jgi:hypothetical protein
MTLRRPFRLQPLRHAPVPSLSWDCQQLRFDQYDASEESTLDFLEKLSVCIAPCMPTAAPVQLDAGSFGSSARACRLTKLLLQWHDNSQLLPIRRLLCLLEDSHVIV